MAKARGGAGGWYGWALGVLAALTLVVAAPEHVLDFDEAAGPVPAAEEIQAHGLARTLVDHAAPGHACAAHCAAHVIGDAPLAAAIPPPSRKPLMWPAAADQSGRGRPPIVLHRPPKG